MNIPPSTGTVSPEGKKASAPVPSVSLHPILTRAWIILATGVIMVAAVFAIMALHIFKFFWSLFGKRRKKMI